MPPKKCFPKFSIVYLIVVYVKIKTLIKIITFRCPVGCATCLTSFCLTCNSNWELNKKGKCIVVGSDQCATGEFSDGGQCSPCHSDCESCFGENKESCLTCPTPNLLQNHK